MREFHPDGEFDGLKWTGEVPVGLRPRAVAPTMSLRPRAENGRSRSSPRPFGAQIGAGLYGQ
ncbi:hypothetical protein K377_03198 [Streptomyces sp. PsTaAH-137]|nr:hypothetical protein K377_03198 [Streptomyces sp. PsTaAH-137]